MLLPLSLLKFISIVQGAVIPARDQKPNFDLQAHRGGRFSTVENTLASHAWGLIYGATTLELDFGVTKDGIPVVWHDEAFTSSKCKDTNPVVENDEMFPYNDKHLANLTLAQVKTLDCGSERQDDFPSQLTYSGLKLSTLQEFFDFVNCADPSHTIAFDIETKVNPAQTNSTRDPEIFTHLLLDTINKNNAIDRSTIQSFDWRTLILSKQLEPKLKTSALYDDTTVIPDTPWLGGQKWENWSNLSAAEAGVKAAKAINADIVSPAEVYSDSDSSMSSKNYKPFMTENAVKMAHDLNMQVKPWTVNRLEVVEEHVKWGVDGIITDNPHDIRRWGTFNADLNFGKTYDEDRVLKCFDKHAQFVSN